MNTVHLALNPDEVALLLRMLENALGETKVELHRTHFSPEFREEVKDEARLLQGMLERLRQASHQG